MNVRHYLFIKCVLVVFCMSLVSTSQAAAPPAYETETWPDAPVLVWAKPGQDGKLDEPGNWRQANGKPARTAPTRDTDIVLPASNKPYRVSGGRNNQVRHVVIENNAILTGGHRNEVEIWGNCHVKAGGFSRYISVRGDRHTFFKVDESLYPNPENGKVYGHPSRRVSFEQLCPGHLSHKFQVCKFGTASVEFIGNLGVSDEIMVQCGKMIVNGEFRYSGATNKGALEIYDGGILEIQSGSRVAPFFPTNKKAVYNVNIYRNGTLQAGSPERPLTEDAYLSMGFGENDKPGRTGLYMALGSMLRVYTTDPEKARLVFTSIADDPGFRDGKGKLLSGLGDKAQGKVGVAMQLAGDIKLDGAHFDYICDGGIGLPGGQQPEDWKNVTWGSHVAGKPASLFSEMAVDPNSYYHARGDQKSEWNLTVMATKRMQDYLEDNDKFRIATIPPTTTIVEKGKGKQLIRTPAAKVFTKPIQVAFQTRVPGAKIRYTLDGSEPTKDSLAYTGPFKLDATTKIMAKAYKPGLGFSPVFSNTYVFE